MLVALNPRQTVHQIARAIPADLRANVIIVGSLAAGYHFFQANADDGVRTKDADLLLSPHAAARITAGKAAEVLMRANWEFRADAGRELTLGASKDLDALPMVRLRPPGSDADSWYVELLSAPPPYQPGAPAKQSDLVSTKAGDFVLFSFRYLALAEWQPLPTDAGVRYARPAMMALANLLHHPKIDGQRIGETDILRSNKDLGRVLALAHLQTLSDQVQGTRELAQWADEMWQALQAKFGQEAKELALRAGTGVRELASSGRDLEQAIDVANRGLLAFHQVDKQAFQAIGRRFEAEVLEVLAELATAS